MRVKAIRNIESPNILTVPTNEYIVTGASMQASKATDVLSDGKDKTMPCSV
jgi:hypothetical protein